MEPITNDPKLPYLNMTLDEFRALVARHAHIAEQRFGELVERMTASKFGSRLTEAEMTEYLNTHHAALYGWATVSLIGFIRDRLGEQAAFEAAAMVDDMGTNGDAPYTDDLPCPPTEAAGSR